MVELKITNFEVCALDVEPTATSPDDWRATITINNATWFGSHSKQTRHAYAFSAHKPLLFSLHAPKGKLTMRVKVNTSTIGRGQLLKAQPMTIRRDEAHQCLHFLLSDGRTAKADVLVLSQQADSPKRSFWQLLGSFRLPRSSSGHHTQTPSTSSLSSTSGSDSAPTIATDSSSVQEELRRAKRQRISQSGTRGFVSWLRRRSQRQPNSGDGTHHSGSSTENVMADDAPELATHPSSENIVLQAASAGAAELVPSRHSAPVPRPAPMAPDRSRHMFSDHAQLQPRAPDTRQPQRAGRFTSVCTNPLFLDGADGAGEHTTQPCHNQPCRQGAEVRAWPRSSQGHVPSSAPGCSNEERAGEKGPVQEGGDSDEPPAAPLGDADIESALQLLSQRAMPPAQHAEFEDAIRSAQQVVDHALGRALLDSVLQQITPYDQGQLDEARGWYVKVLRPHGTMPPPSSAASTAGAQQQQQQQQPSAAADGNVCLRLTYTGVDQMVLGATHACTCISLLAARAALRGQQLSAEGYAGIIREGAALWRSLCSSSSGAASPPAATGGPPSSSSSCSSAALLDFHTTLQSVPGCYESLEAHAQISSQGLGSDQTTLPQCLHTCMARPGTYILTTAGHTTAVLVRRDGSVQWCDSLGAALAPSCQSGYIAHFCSVREFACAFVQLHVPTDGTASVAVELHGLASAPVSNVGFFTFFA